MTTWCEYVLAYLGVMLGGWLVVGACLYVMRWLCLEKPTSFVDLSVLFLGATERAVALTLVLLAPSYLAAFIGGWVALKFALGWQRETTKPEVLTGSMLSLIGNVISFAIAIAVGVLLYPDVLKIWAATSKG